MLSLVRKFLIVICIIRPTFGFSESEQLHALDPFLGVWVRVYDECGDWIPPSQAALFEKAREFVPFRETRLTFDFNEGRGFYEAHVQPSRAY